MIIIITRHLYRVLAISQPHNIVQHYWQGDPFHCFFYCFLLPRLLLIVIAFVHSCQSPLNYGYNWTLQGFENLFVGNLRSAFSSVPHLAGLCVPKSSRCPPLRLDEVILVMIMKMMLKKTMQMMKMTMMKQIEPCHVRAKENVKTRKTYGRPWQSHVQWVH